MAATKAEYKELKQSSPRYVILHKLHAADIHQIFGCLPLPIVMSWDNYDKYVHLDDLCAYDLVFFMLGPAIASGAPPFMLDAPRKWGLAIGKHDNVVAEGEPVGDSYRVSLRPATKEERRPGAHLSR
jgi:hypothetical protein